MALVKHTLFGVQDKVAIAIERLKSFEPPEGYYLAFSGGKDSITIKALADEAGVKYDAHYNLTGIDPPELVRFIRKHHPDVEWSHPEKTIFAMMLDPANGFPPTRQGRWCCELLKEQGGAGRVVVTGIRWAESARRRNRKMVEQCLRGANRRFLHPIIDWEEKDVWEYIRARELPYCGLYDEGWKRIGCLMCPMAGKARSMHAKRYPRYARLWVRALQRLIDLRREQGRPYDFQTGQDFFDWWISDKPPRKDEDLPLFA